MEIESNRSKYSIPLSPMMRPQCMDQSEPMDVQPVRPSIPHGESAKITRTLERRDAILDAASNHKQMAERYKALWLCEILRGEHGQCEAYSVAELARARAEALAWSTFQGEEGAITAYRKTA